VLLLGECLWAGDSSSAGGAVVEQAAQPEEVRYLRVTRDSRQQPAALQTAVTCFHGRHADQEVQIDLVGAVHVGEKEYYDQLNKLFESYDAVLFELVAPEGARVVPGQSRGRHPVSMLQHVMKDVLKLEFQLDCVDYSVPNMVHADMSPAEFSQSMKDRGESFWKMFVRAMGQAMTQHQQQRAPSDLELLVALVARDRDLRLKRLMAEQFEHMEGQLEAINGPDGSTIITERNKRALQVLREQLEKGRKRLAIFYGAGHLSDMAKRLEQDFGMERKAQRWLVAWQIAAPEPVVEEQPVSDRPLAPTAEAAAADGR
jgi:hypothetical protein